MHAAALIHLKYFYIVNKLIDFCSLSRGECVRVCSRNGFSLTGDIILKLGAGHDLITVYSMDWLF